MNVPPDGVEGLNKKLESATRHIHANMAAFSAKELEEMVREKLLDAREVPADLRSDFVKHRLGLRK